MRPPGGRPWKVPGVRRLPAPQGHGTAGAVPTPGPGRCGAGCFSSDSRGPSPGGARYFPPSVGGTRRGVQGGDRRAGTPNLRSHLQQAPRPPDNACDTPLEGGVTRPSSRASPNPSVSVSIRSSPLGRFSGTLGRRPSISGQFPTPQAAWGLRRAARSQRGTRPQGSRPREAPARGCRRGGCPWRAEEGAGRSPGPGPGPSLCALSRRPEAPPWSAAMAPLRGTAAAPPRSAENP